MDEKADRLLLIAIAVGVAAGAAAAITSVAVPHAITTTCAVLRAKGKKGHHDHRHHSKLDKSKKSSNKSKENELYKDVLRQSLLDWRDIDVSFDDFPYFLCENAKGALLDSMYIYLKCPGYVKYIENMVSVSRRILLTGPPGSEIYQEILVKALAKQLQVKLLVLDVTKMLLDTSDLKEVNAVSCASTKSSETNGISSSATKDIKAPLETHHREIQPRELLNSKTNASTMSVSGTTAESKHQFRRGDRVKFVGPSSSSSSSSSSSISTHRTGSRGPSVGLKGRVLLVLEENIKKVGVRFDKPFYGGNTLVDLCEDGHGYFCNVSDLRLEHSTWEDADKLMWESIMDLSNEEASKEPLILFIKDVEKSMMGNIEHYKGLEQLDKNDNRLVIIGSYTSENQKEKGSSRSGSSLSALLDLPFLDSLLSRSEDFKGDGPKASRMLLKYFPTRMYLQGPQEETLCLDWKRKLEQDMEKLKVEANQKQLRLVMGAINVLCDDLSSVEIKNLILNQEMSEKIVTWAISHEVQTCGASTNWNGKLVISAKSLQRSLEQLLSVLHTSPLRKKNLKDVVCDNEFERILLSEFIPPDELGVTFNHIGALDNVKEALRELVMLPLQRPELFTKGQLSKPCRGLLLFGPPGTGKTMLAKAVATEASANFINISLATIASKWFGEAEKYVRAVFTLASKIAPCVIFIDEVDSMLGRRGKDTEHSAMRKLKNEFMSSWDGLRTRERERVLVLAATNRPFDLDEAVIRRFPRRVLVDLPDAKNRVKILRVILQDEDLEANFNFEELAAVTDNYSGSDLKNLCTAAAYQRIREILEHEKKEKEKAIADGVEPPHLGIPYIRPLTMADMKLAMEKVRSSVAADAVSMLELQRWNGQYGEGGSYKPPTLSYFL